ncbi:MAG: CBS domain-containing protein [Candidatus Lokiarchaeota archaeon]|nr:CBS domain-containing protein [Candidatus Harpocratesius repetitus]
MCNQNKACKELHEIKAENIMSRDVTVVEPMEKLSTAEILMIKKNIGGLPVVSPETKKLIGILTQRDIQISKTLIGTDIFHVDDIYSKNPVVGKPDESLPKIIKKMNQYNIERVPIVDDKDHVIGIVVTKDLIRSLAEFFDDP